MQDAVDAKKMEDAKEEMEEVEVRKPNRHERRRRAKLARMQASKEKVESQKLTPVKRGQEGEKQK